VQNVSLQREVEFLNQKIQQHEDIASLADDIRTNCQASMGLAGEILTEKEKSRNLEVPLPLPNHTRASALLMIAFRHPSGEE
jgi:hypothetical protein